MREREKLKNDSIALEQNAFDGSIDCCFLVGLNMLKCFISVILGVMALSVHNFSDPIQNMCIASCFLQAGAHASQFVVGYLSEGTGFKTRRSYLIILESLIQWLLLYLYARYIKNWDLDVQDTATLAMIGFLAIGSICDSIWEIYAKRKRFKL